MTPNSADSRLSPRVWGVALIPLALLGALIYLIIRTGPAERLRGEGVPPVEKLAIERAVLTNDGIDLYVLNDGPDPVTIAQVTVDDAYWSFTSESTGSLRHLGRTRLTIPYPWVVGEAHLIKVMTSTGTTFEHEIPVAVRTPKPDGQYLLAFTLIGLYVGVIPVALGLLWLPLASRLGKTGIDVLLALTVGLLVFLFVDATHEALEASAEMPASYQGVALFVSSAVGAYLVLEWFGAWLRARRASARDAGSPGFVLALLIAVGIGLHNFGEGLAIGAAYALGEAALGTLLVIGFTLHNTTEGLAIVAPIAKERPSVCDAHQARTHWRLADDRGRLGRRPRLFADSRCGVSRARRRRDRSGGVADRAAGRWREAAAGEICNRAGHGRPPRGLRRDVRHRPAGWMMMKQIPVRVPVLLLIAVAALVIGPRLAGDALNAGDDASAARVIHLVARDMTFYVAGESGAQSDNPCPRRRAHQDRSQ